jgi:uroporphyrinogen-III decarboxylase
MYNEMSSYERTLCALKRQQPDRPPVFCFCDQSRAGTSEGFRRYVAAHADVFANRLLYTGFQCTGLEPETIQRKRDDGWTETEYRFETGLRLSEVSKAGEKGDYIGYSRHLIRSRGDMEAILALPYVPPAANQRLAEWIAEIETYGASFCARGAFFRIAFLGPLGTLAGAVSPEDFAILAMEEEALVGRYLDVVLERQAEYIDFILSRLDVPAIMNIGGAEYAIPPLMAPGAFAELIAPYDGELIRLMHRHDRLVYYHSHGKVRRFLPQFIAMGADGIHPLEPVGTTGDCDLAEVKREFGRDICLIGNIQYDDLARLPARGVEERVREVMAVGKPGGGFILSPSCTPYHNPMPAAVEENIIAFIEAGLRYGAS